MGGGGAVNVAVSRFTFTGLREVGVQLMLQSRELYLLFYGRWGPQLMLQSWELYLQVYGKGRGRDTVHVTVINCFTEEGRDVEQLML